MLVLDTHIALWWTLEPKRLSRKVLTQINREKIIGIPTIIFWETALLVRKNKLELTIGAAAWAQKVCNIPRVINLPLSTEIALLADSLEMHADPADRFIVATAIIHKATLATKDTMLRQLRFINTTW
ncbi:MAG: type II toxin-antitoxin system VapC family toxin [Deltaproteobacteria bacterium]|nr:type II toxin-antitoxin system VapC family toxin [Deltaproteobacteria bacterium]